MSVKSLSLICVLIVCHLTTPAQPSANEPAGLAEYTLAMHGFDWITKESQHYRIHYLPGSRAEREIDNLVERNEASLESHLAILQVEQYEKVIDLFYFDSREQIKKIVSKPFRALADAASMTVLAVRNDDDIARDAHEIMHVVSYDLWGGWNRRNNLAWLGEGLATFADEPCNGYEQSELAAHIFKATDDSVSLDSLATDFRAYPEMIGYMLMASFVEFVIEEYNVEQLRNLWAHGYDGLEEIFGKDVARLERDWHNYVLSKYPHPDVRDWPELKKHGCR